MGRSKVVPAEEELGLTVEDLFADTLTFTMPWGTKHLEVTWRLQAFTTDLEDRVGAALDPLPEELEGDELAKAEHDQIRGLIEFLADMLESWSLRDKDGPVPTTRERLSKLPRSFLWAVVTEMKRSAAPKAASETPSGDTP